VTSPAVAIVVAAGDGRRLGVGVPKAFVEIGGVPMLLRSVRAALACGRISGVVVVAPPGGESTAASILRGERRVSVVTGGESRHGSVRAGLEAVDAGAEIVVVHDAARPFASSSTFALVVDSLGEADGCVPAIALTDTVKRVVETWVVRTEDRDALVSAQTPQAFRASALREAHERAAADGRQFTDDAAALEWAGFRVRVVEGDPSNVKITTGEDLSRAEATMGT
jgi:2-C-methyl-D-erythritol 4-phosphate cytidylyltransferase